MRRGFTLIEMMVALFIFGLLAAAGVTVMGFAASNRTAVREHSDRLAEFQRLRAVLKSDLSQAAPRRTRGSDGVRAPGPFAGGDNTETGALITLVRRGWENADAAPRASLQYVEYRVASGRLERAARPALDGAALGAPQILYDGVEAAHVEFFSRDQWLTAWIPSEANPLPQAVRLQLTLREIGPVTQLFLVRGTAG